MKNNAKVAITAIPTLLCTDKFIGSSFKQTDAIAPLEEIMTAGTASALTNNALFLSGSVLAYYIAKGVCDMCLDGTSIYPTTNRILKDTSSFLPFSILITPLHEGMHCLGGYVTNAKISEIQPFLGESITTGLASNPHVRMVYPNDFSNFLGSISGIFGSSLLTLGLAELVERTKASNRVKRAFRGFSTFTSFYGLLYSLASEGDPVTYNHYLSKILFSSLNHETGEIISKVITSALAFLPLIYNLYKIKKDFDKDIKKSADTLGISSKEYKKLEKERWDEFAEAVNGVDEKYCTPKISAFFDELECYTDDYILMQKPCRNFAKSFKVPKEIVNEMAECYAENYKSVIEIEDESKYQDAHHKLRVDTVNTYLPLIKKLKGRKSMPLPIKPSILSAIEIATKEYIEFKNRSKDSKKENIENIMLLD